MFFRARPYCQSKRLSQCAVALTLIIAFGIHAVQIEHEHPYHVLPAHSHEGGGDKHSSNDVEQVSVYLHSAERKVFTVLPLPPMYPRHLESREVFDHAHSFVRRGAHVSLLHVGDWYRECLRRGVMHPKLYS